MTAQELFEQHIQEAGERCRANIRARQEQEDNDRFIGRSILFLAVLIAGLLLYALAWWLCGPVLWPFAVLAAGGVI